MTFWKHLTRIERLSVLVFSAIAVLSFVVTARAFYVESTTLSPADGGVVTVGAVGEMPVLNPVFAQNGTVADDLSNLLFAGLVRFSPKTGETVDFLATHTLSRDKRVYSFTIRDGAKWHDGKPVTADDVLFTFVSVLQNPDFGNAFLAQNFRGVVVEKVNDKTVRFILSEPYKFFLQNLSVGLLPSHILADFPVKNLDKSEFSQHPIGSGPYAFRSVSRTKDGALSLSLDRFSDFVGPEMPHLDTIEYRLFSSYPDLARSAPSLDLLREIPADQPFPHSFSRVSLELPQYVGLFLNTDSPILGSQKTRFALQLLTDKNALAETVSQKNIVDTPFMKRLQDDWRFAFDPKRAAGALVDAGWQWPWKILKTTLQNAESLPSVQKNASESEMIFSPSKDPFFATDSGKWYLEGKSPEGAKSIFVNGYRLNLFNPEKGSWSYRVDTAIGTLREGENRFTVQWAGEDGAKKMVDVITVYFSLDEAKRTAWIEKNGSKKAPSSDSLEKMIAETPKTESGSEKIVVASGALIAETGTGFRVNSDGKRLHLTLVTGKTPALYSRIAAEIARQWARGGVEVELLVLEPEALVETIAQRKYDILLFGQTLGHNPDAYPYWHSSQANANGLNLSNFRTLSIDDLLVRIRQTHDEGKRTALIEKLQTEFAAEVPAIFLFSPQRVAAVSPTLYGFDVSHMAAISDQSTALLSAFLVQSRQFQDGVSWARFPKWVLENW